MTYDSAYWDDVAQQMIDGPHYLDDAVGRQKRYAHLHLLQRWLNGHSGEIALKTDLFEEAFGPDDLLSEVPVNHTLVIGMDVSPMIVARARDEQAQKGGQGTCYLACDVRNMPLKSGSLDLILSTSTLDHFSSRQHIKDSLDELARSLSTDGLLIVTLDNGSNIFYPLLRLLSRVGLGPYHIGSTLSIKALISNLESAGLEVTDTAAIIHNPRVLVTFAAQTMHRLCPRRAGRWIRSMLRVFEHLEGRRTQYLTACFIAARAIRT
jgi:SAM-dependent methyltransferase